MTEPPWLLMGRELIGIGEIVGTAHEPNVVAFFADAGVPEIKDDETAWCGAFVTAMFVKAGRREVRPMGDRYDALRARKWLEVGKPVTDPLPGDLVIFERGGKNATTGHVGFYVSETETNIRVLGGNQSNQVSIANYAKARVLGYRRVVQTQKPSAAPVVQPAPSSPPLRASPEPEDALRGDDAPTFWERLLALFGIGKKWPGR